MTDSPSHDSDKQAIDFIYATATPRAHKLLQSTQPPNVKINKSKPKLINKDKNIKIDLWNKPFVGGYLNKKTNRQYHHCGIQYPFIPKHKHKKTKSNHRDTQTVHTMNFKQQTNLTQHTQMDRSDLLLDHSKDKEIDDNKRIFDSDEYITAKQQKIEKIDSAITIQCALRSHFAKNKVQQMKEVRDVKIKENLVQLKKQQVLLEKQQKLLDYKKKNPQHSFEFKNIINSMTKWNSKQMNELLNDKRISKNMKSKTRNKMIYSHNKQLRNLQQRQMNTQKKQKKLQKQNLLNEVTYYFTVYFLKIYLPKLYEYCC